jgi:hypothetical protein
VITDRNFAEVWRSRRDRWEILRQVFEDWRTPLTPADGIETRRLGMRLPAALREWYEIAGARDDLRGRGNRLLRPEELAARDENEMVVFYQENQCVCWWAVRAQDMGLEDPPVFVAEAGDDDWVEEDPTLSQFLLQMTLLEMQFVAPYTANAAAPPALVEGIGRHFEDLGLTWWHWPAYPGRRFAGPGVLINTDGPNATGEAWVWVAARTAAERDAAMETLNRVVRERSARGDARASVRKEIEWFVRDRSDH